MLVLLLLLLLLLLATTTTTTTTTAAVVVVVLMAVVVFLPKTSEAPARFSLRLWVECGPSPPRRAAAAVHAGRRHLGSQNRELSSCRTYHFPE